MPRGRKKKYEKALVLRLPTEIQNDKIALSKDLAKEMLAATGIMEWTSLQRKIFAIILLNIDWSGKNRSNEIEIDNQKALVLLQRHLSGAERNMGIMLEKEITYMAAHSGIELEDPYSHRLYGGNLFIEAIASPLFTTVKVNPTFMPHLEQLYRTKAFIVMLGTDWVSFNCVYSSILYEEFVLHGTAGGFINTRNFSTKQLKELFGLGKYSYMKYKVEVDKQDNPIDHKWLNEELVENNFDRYGFEHRVLIPAIEEINRSEMVQILPWENGQYFYKEKVGGKVKKYHFKFIIRSDSAIVKMRKEALEKASEN